MVYLRHLRAAPSPKGDPMRLTLLMPPLLLSLIACAPPQPAPSAPTGRWRAAPTQLTPPQQAKLDLARAAAQDLGGALLGRVVAAVQADGHAAAIDVCKQEAPAITATIAAKHGLRIGRTAARLRNTKNTAPAWAAEAIAAQAAAPTILLRDDGALGALLPIKLADACVACHGSPDKLVPGVADALATRYPDDQATGFAPGDLRGWFWVEVAP
jgi:hypothetical protein